MNISIQEGGKKFHREWIFRHFNFTFKEGENYALTGSNGSGKSTLLQILTSYHLLSEGKIQYSKGDQKLDIETVFQKISITTPYMDLIEDFTLKEHLEFHFKFRKLKGNLSIQDIIDIAYLSKSEDKFIKNFSSGMKQRLRLALAFYTDSEVIFLDEPTSNLDNQGIDWYHQEIKKINNDRNISLIVASNQDYEYKEYCPNIINIQELKP